MAMPQWNSEGKRQKSCGRENANAHKEQRTTFSVWRGAGKFLSLSGRRRGSGRRRRIHDTGHGGSDSRGRCWRRWARLNWGRLRRRVASREALRRALRRSIDLIVIDQRAVRTDDARHAVHDHCLRRRHRTGSRRLRRENGSRVGNSRVVIRHTRGYEHDAIEFGSAGDCRRSFDGEVPAERPQQHRERIVFRDIVELECEVIRGRDSVEVLERRAARARPRDENVLERRVACRQIHEAIVHRHVNLTREGRRRGHENSQERERGGNENAAHLPTICARRAKASSTFRVTGHFFAMPHSLILLRSVL